MGRDRAKSSEWTVGRANVRVAWWMIGAGMAVGAVLGLWSFGGPVPPPPGFRAFDDLPRRLVRLGHIAAIALPALNLLYVPWHKQLPKLDVAGSIPVARSNDDAGLQGTCSPAFVSMPPLCTRSR